MWFGLATRRRLIVPTWRGGLLLIGFTVIGAVALIRAAYPFLALDTRLPHADVLIVEGWVSDRSLQAAKRELESGRCDLICTVGVDLERGQRLLPWKDWASVAAATLTELGLPSEKLLIAPGGWQQRHRTHASYRAAAEQLAALPRPPQTFNLLSEAHHGRRSRLVAGKVFTDATGIGVLSVAPQSYDPNRWWASSAGAKNVLMELVACAHEALADSGR